VILLLVYKLRTKAVSFVLLVASLATLGMSGVNAVQINTQVEAAKANIIATEGKQALPLTKSGKNVLVIVLDRGLDAMFPYLIHERPELKEQFSGFTWYPNTISHGGYTNFGVPAIYGGYEYTTYQSNQRSDVLLKDKHNEALKLMPTIFSEAGYQVTVTDPTYAGYSHVPDLSIFDDIPNTNAIITRNRYGADVQEKQQEIDAQLDRNFFCYSLMKSAPLAAQGTLYQKGNYNNSASRNTKGKESDEDDSFVQEVSGLSKAEGLNDEFLEWYPVLEHLPDLTEVQEKGENSLVIFKNDSPHEPTLLQLPDYTVEASVDNTAFDGAHPTRSTDDGKTITFTDENQMMHYHSNMATMLRVGEWMDYLKEQGVYDNTRIIIVADHGRKLKLFDDMVFFDGDLDALFYNPLLLVKDFNATGEPKTDNTFMTNADTPTLATDGLIDNPVNPFTGNAINSDSKEGEQYILVSRKWSIDKNNGTTFLEDPWASVHDDIFKEENWKLDVTPKG
jgi:arylsulfatase A-like enzyme